MPDELLASLNELIPTFKALSVALHEEKEAHKAEREERKRFRMVTRTISFFFLICLAAIVSLLIFFHSANSATQQNTSIIRSCVFPPPHPHSVGTPYAQLTCFERNAVNESAILDAILGYERTLDQIILDHFSSGVILPPPTVVLPSGVSIGGSNAKKG